MASRKRAPRASDNDSSEGDVAWQNLANALVNDSTYATVMLEAGQSSNWFIATDFDMNLGKGAVIDGVEFIYDGSSDLVAGVTINPVQLVTSGIRQAISRTVTNPLWVLTWLLSVAGGSADNWGGLDWNDVNQDDFGVGIQVENNGVATVEARLRYIEVDITVEYPVIQGIFGGVL